MPGLTHHVTGKDMILPEHITNWQKEYHIKNVQMPKHEAIKAAWLVISPIICQLWGGHHNVEIWVGGNCFSFPNQGKERYIFGLIVVRYVKACWFQGRPDGWFPWILNNILSCIYKIPTKFMTNWCTFMKAGPTFVLGLFGQMSIKG
jgi:hypothetical protein